MTYNKVDKKIYVLDCENMADPTPQKIRAMLEQLTIKYRPNEIRVEINAHQKAYQLDEDLRTWLGQYGTILKPHFTSKNKWDTQHGVASMSTMLGTIRDGKFQDNNQIEFPSTNGSEGMKALIQQLITWKPNTKGKTDCVMAMWFGFIRCREFMQQSSVISKYTDNRWATAAQQRNRGTINLDVARAQQWEEQYG
jgi:hypothetical protein